MIKITGLTANAFQKMKIPDPNGGGEITLKLAYRPRVQRWFYDIAFKTFDLKGAKLVNSPNVLIKWANIIPFGLLVNVADGFEPFAINDFSTERVTLYLLTSAEVEQFETALNSIED